MIADLFESKVTPLVTFPLVALRKVERAMRLRVDQVTVMLQPFLKRVCASKTLVQHKFADYIQDVKVEANLRLTHFPSTIPAGVTDAFSSFFSFVSYIVSAIAALCTVFTGRSIDYVLETFYSLYNLTTEPYLYRHHPTTPTSTNDVEHSSHATSTSSHLITTKPKPHHPKTKL